MTDHDSNDRPEGFIARNWQRTAALVVALAAFLGIYDAVRNKGRLFLCDLAGVAGQQNLISVCSKDEKPPDDGDLLASLEFLKAREGQLSPERLQELRRLETHFEDRAFARLNEAAGLQDAPADVEAEAATREAVRETVEEGDPEERRAIALIAEGDLQGGLQVLSDLALASTQDTAEQWRRIGRLAYSVDTARALDAYGKVVTLDQSDPWDAIYLGRLHVRAGALGEANRVFSKSLAAEPEERDRSVLMNEIGDVQRAQGDLAAALTSYRAALEISEQLARQDTGNASWQRDLSVSHERIGDVQLEQGDLAAALTSYRAALEIREQLARQDTGNASWQRDLSVSHNKIGDVQLEQGDLAAALTSYRATLEISEQLARQDTGNASWQRDLSVSHNKIGDVEELLGNVSAAIVAYETSLPIAKSLADRFPDHPQFQSDIVITRRRLEELRRTVQPQR